MSKFLLLLFALISNVCIGLNLFVSSTNGNDTNNGFSITKPVKTLFKCMDIITDIRGRQNKIENITVFVDNGIYSPITLNPRYSNITFIGSNNTIISNGYPLNSQWTKQNNNNNIWTTTIPLPSNYSRKIYQNNSMRFPKQLWYNNARRSKKNTDILYWVSALNPSDPKANINKYGLVYKKGDIQQSWDLYAAGVTVYVFAQWTVSIHQIKHHFFNNQTIIFEQPSTSVLEEFIDASQQRWYIEGIPEMELITNSGEWNAMFDDIKNPKNIIINYAAFNNETFPPKQNNLIYIEHPFNYTPLVSIIGTEIKRVENMVFNGFDFKYSTFLCPPIPKPCDGNEAVFMGSSPIPGAIQMRYTQNITIKNSIFRHIGSFGLYLLNTCVQTNILYNNFTDIGAGGVLVGGDSNNSVISDNYFADGGFIVRSSAGIGGGSAANVTIEHNEMTRLIANGINFAGHDNESPYFVINKNHIHHNGRSDKWGVSDYGAFHVGFINQTCCTTRVTNNLFHDIVSVVLGGNGVYLDHASSDIYVYGNLVYNIAGYALDWNYQAGGNTPRIYPAPPIVIKNNIFIMSGSGQSKCFDGMYLPNTTRNNGIHWGSGPPPYIGNGVFSNNIAYIIKPNGSALFTQSQKEEYEWFINSTYDYNVYYTQIGGKDIYFPGNDTDTQIVFEQWQSAAKQDKHSEIIDPKFVNVENCNFELQTDSPVYKDIDFQILNISDVGPRY